MFALFCIWAMNSRTVAAAAVAAGTISMHAASAGAVQNNGTVSVLVSRTNGTSGAASVVCKSVNNTAVAGQDFTAVNTILYWASGDSSPRNCTVSLSDATPYSVTKTFFLELSGVTGASLASFNKTTVSIYGNKGGGAVSVSAPTYNVAQNIGTMSISVDRTGGSVGTAVVFYSTANKTAIAGTDYSAVSGVLSWANGDAAAKTISIPISNAKPFAGTKTLAVALAHAENVTLGGTTSAIVTISGDAVKPTVTIAATPSAVGVGASPTLSWKTSNAATCTASGGWTGLMPTSGTLSTSPISESTSYALTCTGSGGSTTQSATVAVSAATAVANVAPSLSCSGTSGPLMLKVAAIRDAGISPFLVFFDATGTTDSSISGKGTPFQDVSYTWNFGDTGASGTDTWAYGSNKSHNSRNTATGGVAAHLYATAGVDTAYAVTVTAHNGANTASCQLGISAYDPGASHGFAETKTTCVSSSGTPASGSSGCPAGAATLNTSSFNTAIGSSHFGSGKRVLFKCGDTFTGDNATLSGTTWSVGAYGSCAGTQTGRPIMRDSGTSGQFTVAMTAGDGRIADLDFEGNGTAAHAVETAGGGSSVPYQITLYNLYSNGNNSSYAWSQGAQWAIVESVMTGMRTSIGTYANYAENNQAQWTGNPFNNIQYQAFLGNLFNGAGGTAGTSGQETVRVSACRMCVIENNTFENANNIGAVLKIHSGNTYLSSPTWTGVYTELLEISDNLFTGTSGAQLVENAPQNESDDERLRNIVVERNLFSGSTGAQGGRQLLVSAVNETVRDNVFYITGTSSQYPAYGVQIARRGIEPVASGVEVYNNTCYARTAVNGEACAGFDGMGMKAPGINSFAQNNLFYIPATGHTTVVNEGTGNMVGNNTAAPSNNPDFTDGSGSFSLISDFKPTLSFAGGVSVPVWYDAAGVSWSSTWDLGAVRP